MPEAKAHAKQFYESDPRCFNPKLQLSLVLAGLGYIDVVFNERFAFSDNPAYPGCKKMVDMLFSLYSDASGMAHTGRDGGHRDCSWLLRRFYTAAGMLLQVDVPAADFSPPWIDFYTGTMLLLCRSRTTIPSPPPSAVRWTSARRATACSASPMKPRLPFI